MAKTRRIVRKIKPLADAPFDEQLWPVNVALLVLGGYLAGVILRIFPFDEPNLLRNAITWLAAVVIVIPSIMWGLYYVDDRTMRRRVQFAAVLGVIIILTIMVIMATFDLIPIPVISSTPTKDPLDQEIRVTMPDYNPVQHERDRPKQDFEKPVETKTPEPEQEEVPHERPTPEEPKSQPQPTPVPEPPETVRDSALKKTEVAESAPRRSERQSDLSRQLASAQPRPATPVAIPNVTTHAEKKPARVEARSTQVARDVTQIQVRQRTSDAEPTTQRTQETIKVARRQTDEAPVAQSTATPTLKRQLAQPRLVPRSTAAVAETPAVAKQTSPEAARPNNTAATKQSTAGVRVAETAAEPTPHVPTTVAQQTVPRQQHTPRAPTLAQTPQSMSTRRTVSLAPPSIASAAAAPIPTRAPTRSSTTQLRPSPSTVARQPVKTPTTNRTLAAADVPSSGTRTHVAQASTRRARPSPVPTINPRAMPTGSPARSVRPAATAASPAPIASPMPVHSAEPRARPSAQPNRTALSRSFGGIAGVGRSANLDRGLPTSDHVAMVASGSAMRRRATQNIAEGPALAPRSAARVSRSRAGADVPTTTLRAQNADFATAAGSHQPAQLEASASAALTHAGSNVTQGPTTASKGNVEVDFGPTQVVSNSGSNRRGASGGGQPTLNFNPQPLRVARSGTGSGPTVSVAANQMAAVPEAPEGSGGGAPTLLQPNTEAVAAARTDTAGELPTSGGPTAVDDTGPPEVASSAPAVGSAEIGRADLTEAAPGTPEPGGGTGSPTRSSTGPALVANTTAEAVTLTGEPESSGAPEGAPIEAQGIEQARAATGLPARASDAEVGAIAGAEAVDSPRVGEPGVVTGIRRTSPSREEGPVVGDVTTGGAPLRRAETTGLPTGLVAQVEVPIAGASSPEAQPDTTDFASGMDDTGIRRQAAGAIPVSVDAPEGPGGLGDELTPNAGMLFRRAQSESPEVHFRTARFIRRQGGGPPGMNLTATRGTDAFDRRARREGDDTGGDRGRPSPKTEEAIESGLYFLARHQFPDGSWTLNNFGSTQPEFEEEYVDEKAKLHTDTAATGLVLMAFLGAGYQHKDDKYAEVIGSGLEYLIKNQKDNGDLYLSKDEESNRSVWLYSHGIAAIALCEAYGMTQDPNLREPAQKALNFIVQSQNEERGGWRYSPTIGSDTSVTGWLMMALKSGQLANLDVPKESFEKIEKWLDGSQASSGQRHLYRYNPLAPDTDEQRHGREPNKTMTSVGLLTRRYTGWKRDHPAIINGAEYLLENLPEIGSRRNPQRDTYYWYYSTQVMFHMGGRYWEQWKNRLHPLLTQSQITKGTFAGSWDPRRPLPDRWAPHGGRMYVTTLNLLSLEVEYRYLPIYEDTAK